MVEKNLVQISGKRWIIQYLFRQPESLLENIFTSILTSKYSQINVKVEIMKWKKTWEKIYSWDGMRLTKFYSHKAPTNLPPLKFKVLLVKRHKTKLKKKMGAKGFATHDKWLLFTICMHHKEKRINNLVKMGWRI